MTLSCSMARVLVPVMCAAVIYAYAADCAPVTAAGEPVDTARAGSAEIRTLADPLAHYITGMVFDNYGRTEEAVKEYSMALEERPGDLGIRVKLGSSLMYLGKLDEAEEVLLKAKAAGPEDSKPYLLLAIIYTAKGDFPKAQAEYEEALKYDPGNIKILTFLSDLYIIQRKLDLAAATYERIIEKKKDDQFLYFNLGVIYSKLDRLDKAEDNLLKAVEVDSEYVQAQMVLGFIYEVSGKYEQAIDRYREVLRIEPDSREAVVRLGQLYYRSGDTAKALESNRMLMKMDEDSEEPYLRNFSIYVAENDHAGAEGVLREAILNGVSSAVIYASLGYLANMEDDHREAALNYGIAAEKDPSNTMYRFYLAASLDRSGKKDEAIRILEEIVSGKDAPPEAYNYLGYIYVEEGRQLERAAGLIEKALEADPDNGAYLDSLGWAYYKMGRLDAALEQLRKAVVFMPDDPVIREHIGDVYGAAGDIGKALDEWRAALSFDRDNERIKKKIREAVREIKERKEAEDR